MDYLVRGMDATAYTLPTFLRFVNAVAILIGQGEEWPTDGTAHLGSDAWELAKERLRIPKRLGVLGVTDATSKCPVGRVACVIDCVWRGLGKADARNKGPVIRHPLAYRSFPPPYLTR